MFPIATAIARYIIADLPARVTSSHLADLIEDAVWEIFDSPMFAGLSEADHEKAVTDLSEKVARAIFLASPTRSSARTAAALLIVNRN